LACLKHSARAADALADCFCAAASEIDNAKSAGTSRANANRAFGVCIIASFFGYRHNARSECTTISGDHLAEDEESPLPQMRKVARLWIEISAAGDTEESRFLASFF
jgi:hypothetical protein